MGVLRAHRPQRGAGREAERVHRSGALSGAATVADRVPPSAAELPAAADRRRHRPGGRRDRARGHAFLPGAGTADHRAVAGIVDRQRLSVSAVGEILDQLLPRRRAAPHHRQHQSRRGSVARRAQSAPATMTEALLSVDRLRTYFFTKAGVCKAVDDASFAIDGGEVLGLVGESGSGKSMTGYSIMGLVDPPGRVVGGRILLAGRDLAALPAEEMRQLRGNRIAMIFQDPMMTLNPVLRVDTQMIETIVAHRNVGADDARAMARSALAKVGIPSPDARMTAYPHQFSGGMRQRVAIAIALLNEPDVIIADEPTTALDVTIQGQILYEMQKLTRETGAALIWITHDLSVIAGLADRVCVMYAGRIVEQGATADVLRAPRHPYTRGLLDSVPANNARGARLKQIPGMTPSLLDLPPGCPFRERCAYAQSDCVQTPLMRPLSASGPSLRCHHPLA